MPDDVYNLLAFSELCRIALAAADFTRTCVDSHTQLSQDADNSSRSSQRKPMHSLSLAGNGASQAPVLDGHAGQAAICVMQRQQYDCRPSGQAPKRGCTVQQSCQDGMQLSADSKVHTGRMESHLLLMFALCLWKCMTAGGSSLVMHMQT